MVNIKTAKVQAEIDKAKTKLAEQQAYIKSLEAKHTELENMEIVDIVRGLNIPLDDLAAVLQSVRGGAAPATVTASGQVGPKPKAATNKNDDSDKEGEPE